MRVRADPRGVGVGLVGCLLSIVGCAKWSAPAEMGLDPTLESAWKALDSDDGERALELLDGRGAARDAPFDEASLRQDALCAIGRSDDALREARARLEASEDADAHVLLARLLDDRAARVELTRALEFDPTHVYARLGLGTLAARANDLEAAESYFGEALDVLPPGTVTGDPVRTRALLHRRRAEVRARLGDFSGAQSDLGEWLARRPDDRAARMSRALMLQEHLDRGDEAEADYRLLLDLDPTDASALVALAVRYQERDELETAERLYLAAAGREPTAWFNLGLLYTKRLDRLEDAKACFERFLEQDDPDVDAADRILYAPNLIEELERAIEQRGQGPAHAAASTEELR